MKMLCFFPLYVTLKGGYYNQMNPANFFFVCARLNLQIHEKFIREKYVCNTNL